jgi:hypothetical protein
VPSPTWHPDLRVLPVQWCALSWVPPLWETFHLQGHSGRGTSSRQRRTSLPAQRFLPLRALIRESEAARSQRPEWGRVIIWREGRSGRSRPGLGLLGARSPHEGTQGGQSEGACFPRAAAVLCSPPCVEKCPLRAALIHPVPHMLMWSMCFCEVTGGRQQKMGQAVPMVREAQLSPSCFRHRIAVSRES